MIDTLNQIVNEINSLPEYFGKGILELIILIVGGIVVGWITSTYFAQRAAESEVKGDIMKKKLDIYDALVIRLEAILQQVVLPHNIINIAVSDIKEHDIPLEYVPQYPVLDVFQTGDKLKETVLDIDSFISTNRIYFEKGLYEKLEFFQNYIVIFNRLIVMYQEHFIDSHIPLDNKNVKMFEKMTAIELGLIFQDELTEEIVSVYDEIRDSINHIKFKVQSKPDHSEKRLGHKGEIIQQMLDMKIMTEREKVLKLIALNIAKAMAVEKGKKL